MYTTINHQLVSPSLAITKHAQQRMAQRNLSCNEIGFIMDYSRPRFVAGAVFFVLRKKDIPWELRHNSAIARLEGVTVVASNDNGDIMTVYRAGQNGPRKLRRKA